MLNCVGYVHVIHKVGTGPDFELDHPSPVFTLPEKLPEKKSLPSKGHGITIAAYDAKEQIGLLRWLGIVTGGTGTLRNVDWRPTSAQIHVDSATGRGYWQAGAFGVQLPFVYTIPLCVWFYDCHAAERRYHEMFSDKHINGEWFDLTESDIQQIRLRA